jgi:Putative Flp pilus-assembly TadE/G-like
MNSIHRIGLIVAGIVTALVVAGAFVVEGYTSAIATQNQSQNGADAATQAPATDTPGAASFEPTVIYVRPAPTAASTIPQDASIFVIPATSTLPPTPEVAPTPQPPDPTQAPTPRPTFGDGGGGDD